MNKTEEIFTKKQFKAEVKSANVTDSGLALKLIVPFTEMMPIIPTLAESIGQVVNFEYTLPQGNLLNVMEWKNPDQTELNLDPQINKTKDQDEEDK
ncbi:hypothetical protein [Pseudolactococcus reticulitermitis]|uniref:Uncharacterized protein n=1 Tax=Pseudolactococcus reticulitermitis TaxID=2025039 RepID=A0A224XCD6_9LACT|nr:hypothetical protein [Lactococcus reticulitermitis]GAX47291.1 hypothetical protein RsY01_890 [Lactococcus reticulitermitis]